VTAVGFIGTGVIGRPMAERVLAAGHDLVVFDARPEAAAALVEAGARWAASARAVAEQCRIVLLSLPGPQQVDAVMRGADGVLAGAEAGDVVVDLSTNAVDTVRRLAETAVASGVRYLDAPVSGGAIGAAAGTLSVMVSGDRDAFDVAEPVISAFGKAVTYLGRSGNGTIVKLVNNQIFLCATLVFEEAVVMASKAGLDPAELLAILKQSSAAPYTFLASLVLGRRFDAGIFSLALAEKDVALALESARSLAVPMPVTAAAHQTYLQALASGLGHEDFVAALKTIETAAATVVPAVDPPA
jgi:3-hydroxyisobutyrate dehydrogenase-like beta-hydroxyacid dehydrogenase